MALRRKKIPRRLPVAVRPESIERQYETLIAKYSDGYINPPADVRNSAIPVGYPANWLRRTNYAQGPTSYRMKAGG